jgi:hypothetical protein
MNAMLRALLALAILVTAVVAVRNLGPPPVPESDALAFRKFRDGARDGGMVPPFPAPAPVVPRPDFQPSP